MFDGMFDGKHPEELGTIKEHLKYLDSVKKEGTALLSKKLDDCGPDVLTDSVMLCPGTAPFEWDATINEKLNLGGNPVLLQVCIPKAIMTAFSLKNKIYEEIDKEQIDVHKSTHLMLQLIFLKGVASFIHDEDGLRNKIMARQLMEMMKHLNEMGEDD